LDNSKIAVEILFPSLDWNEVKIHVAQKAGQTRPIDVFTRSFDDWQNVWNGDFHSNHCWNRRYIFSIIELPTQPENWLFGGVFEVLSYEPGKYHTGKEGIFYKVSLAKHGISLIGRLVIHWTKDARAKGRKAETMLNNMHVSEILPETYAGEDFPGYSKINHRYDVLEKLWLDSKADWVAALKYCQGVYLITDLKTGLRYVGASGVLILVFSWRYENDAFCSSVFSSNNLN